MATIGRDRMIGVMEGRPDAERTLRRPGSAGGTRDIEADELRVRRLVARAKAGDGAAMRALYLHFAPTISAYVARIVPSEQDAEDVTQHTFAKLMTELARYEPGPAPFRAWMLRVARNAAIDHIRQTRALPSDGVPDAGARGVYCLRRPGRVAACTALAELESAPATPTRGPNATRWPRPVELETARA